MRTQSASRTVKLRGLKSVKHMAELVQRDRSALHKMYTSDREMFDSLLEIAVKRAG